MKHKIVLAPKHPRANRNGMYFEHILIAEKALGRYMPDGAEVHHWDKDVTNNKPSNLLICEDRTYHRLIHIRMEAYEETGNANLRRCFFCRLFDQPDRMKQDARGFSHKECGTEAYKRITYKRSIGKRRL